MKDNPFYWLGQADMYFRLARWMSYIGRYAEARECFKNASKALSTATKLFGLNQVFTLG